MVFDSLWPPWTIPWNPPDQNTGEDSLSLLQQIFLTQELNQGLLHCTWIVYQLSHQGSPDKCRQHIKRQRYYLPTKVRRVNAMIFPVVVYGCESCTIKKAEHWRIDTFEPSCWMRLLRFPDNACRSNHSILKEIDPEYSLEELMLRLQYFGHLESWSLEKTMMLGKIEGRRRGWQRMRWQRTRWLDGITQWTWVWTSSEIWWRSGKPGVLQSMDRKELDAIGQLNNNCF